MIADYNGYWKLPQETINAILDVEPHPVFNSQYDFTDTCAGQAVIAEWADRGCPTKVIERYSVDYVAAMQPVSMHVMRHIEDGGNCSTEDDHGSLGIEEP